MSLSAQTVQLSAWDFDSGNTTPTLATGIASANIAAGGGLVRATNPTNSFIVSGMSALNLAQAQNGVGTVAAQYISFTMSPSTNYAFDVASVAIQGYSQNINRSFNLSYISPTTGTLVSVQTQTISTPTQNRTYNITGLTNLNTPLEFRVYIFSNPIGAYQVAGFGEQSGLDLVVNGRTYSTTTPVLPGMWSLQGNTVGGTQFLGSTNNQALLLKANNTTGITINTDGSVQTNNLTVQNLAAQNLSLTGNAVIGGVLNANNGLNVNGVMIQNGKPLDFSNLGVWTTTGSNVSNTNAGSVNVSKLTTTTLTAQGKRI